MTPSLDALREVGTGSRRNPPRRSVRSRPRRAASPTTRRRTHSLHSESSCGFVCWKLKLRTRYSQVIHRFFQFPDKARRGRHAGNRIHHQRNGHRGARRARADRRRHAPRPTRATQNPRRNGAVVSFEPSKIAVALMKAFLAVHGTQGAASASVRETVDGLTESVVRALLRSRPAGGTFHIEDIQDQVELGLMRGSHHEVARAYVLYRERRSQDRQKSGAGRRPSWPSPSCLVTDKGERVPMDVAHLHSLIVAACADLGPDVHARAGVRRDPPQPVRRRADGRGLQGRHPGLAHPHREGTRLHAAPRPAC